MPTFTYSKKQKQINDFLEKELSNIDSLIAIHSQKAINNNFIDYSNALFVFANAKEKDSVILN